MASKIYREGVSPSASFTILPEERARQGSLSSLSGTTQPDKEVIAQALDQIHSSASRSDSLTTFNEYTSPPSSSSGPDSKGVGGDLQGGISGLYNRFLASVGNSRDAVGTGSDDRYSEKGLVENPRVPSPTSPISLQDVDDSPGNPQHRREQKDDQIKNLSTKRSANESNSPLDRIPSLKPPPTPLKQLGKSSDQNAELGKVHNRKNDRSRRSQLSDIEIQDAGHTVGEKRQVISDDTKPPRYSENKKEQLPLPLQEDNSMRKPSPILHLDATSRPRGVDVHVNSKEDSLKPLLDDVLGSGQGETGFIAEDKARKSDNYQHLEIPLRKSLAPPIVNRSASPRPSLSRASSTDTNADSIVSISRHPGSSPVLSKQDYGNRDNVAKRTLQDYSKPAVLLDPRSMSVFSQVKNKVLNKEYWMKDENARDCFSCGDSFSTFRRKHHCSERLPRSISIVSYADDCLARNMWSNF